MQCPAFFYLAAVAYNLQFRSHLISLKNRQQFERFFRNQNPLNLHKFLAKIYDIADRFALRFTDNNHDKDTNKDNKMQSLMTLNKLPIGSYPIYFENFVTHSSANRFITSCDYGNF